MPVHFFGVRAVLHQLGVDLDVDRRAAHGRLAFFGVKNNGSVYGTSDKFGNSQIYVEYTSETANNTALSTDVKSRLDIMLDHAYLDGQKLADCTEFDSYDYTSQYKTTKSGVDTVYYAYYRITFNKALSGEEVISYKNDAGEELFTEQAAVFFTKDTLNSTSLANLNFGNSVEISLKDSVRANADQPEFKSLYSGLPAKRLRSSGFCVAIPMGQVS